MTGSEPLSSHKRAVGPTRKLVLLVEAGLWRPNNVQLDVTEQPLV